AGWVEGWVEACYCVQTRQRPHEDCIAHICTHTHKYVTQTHTHKHTHTNMSHKHTHTHTRTLMCRSEEHTSELQSHLHLVCRLLLGNKRQFLTHTVSPTLWVDVRPHGLHAVLR